LWLICEAGLAEWLSGQPPFITAWVRGHQFAAERALCALLPVPGRADCKSPLPSVALRALDELTPWHVSGLPERLPPRVEEVLLGIAQEALNNALKHAKPKTIRVRLERGTGEARLEVMDDGVGFDVDGGRRRGGLGLRGMSERAAKVRARLSIDSVEEGGTRVRVVVPLGAVAPAPAPAPAVFTFAHASDTHIAPASAARTRRLRVLVDSLQPAFVLIAGDLVRDALRVGEAEATSYYELFLSELRQFTTPAWTVPGNHEVFGIEQAKSHVEATHPLFGRKMYQHYLGPDYYSFTYGGIHFVGLNSVDVDGPSYYGHVDSLQLAWLARDLARIPATMPVVTFSHIPLVSTIEGLNGYTDAPPAPSVITVGGTTVFRHVVSNVTEVRAVLRARPHRLALGAHVHAGEKIAYEIGGVRTRFEQSPAVVGPSEVGPLTFPSGFTVYTVRGGVIDGGRFVGIETGP